jgi:outer membrane protein assembly factor BamB
MVTTAWSVALDYPPSAVAADAGGVVMTVEHQGVVALDDRGRERWASELAGASIGSPLVFGDRVIVPTARADGSGGCAALDRETGATVWTYEAFGTRGVAVAELRGTVICVMRDGRTAGILPGPGFLQWQYTFAKGIDPSTVEVADGSVIAVDEVSGLFAFTARYGPRWGMKSNDVETGASRQLLNLGTGGPVSAPVVVGPGRFAVAASFPNELYAVDVRSLQATRIPIPTTKGFDPASLPLVVDHLVVVVATAGEVTAIDLDIRQRRWTVRVSDPIRRPHPVRIGNAVMLATETGRVVAFRLANGASVRLPAPRGRVVAMLAHPGREGVDVLGREGVGGRIERWEPESGA